MESGKKRELFEKNLNGYDTIYLDMQGIIGEALNDLRTQKELQDKYIEFLREMFKDAAMLPTYALVYMTGILPIKRYGTSRH